MKKQETRNRVRVEVEVERLSRRGSACRGIIIYTQNTFVRQASMPVTVSREVDFLY